MKKPYENWRKIGRSQESQKKMEVNLWETYNKWWNDPPFWICKLTISTGPCSMAMLVITRACLIFQECTATRLELGRTWRIQNSSTSLWPLPKVLGFSWNMRNEVGLNNLNKNSWTIDCCHCCWLNSQSTTLYGFYAHSWWNPRTTVKNPPIVSGSFETMHELRSMSNSFLVQGIINQSG